jgi:hypothetical protein
MHPDFIRRFWAKVRKSEQCWEWQGSRNPDGYGNVRAYRERRTLKCHRVAYELSYGEAPSELHVLHHCDNPACVRPDHLFLGTHTDNMRDKERKGRSVSYEASLTHRVRGHPFDAANTRTTSKGSRECRACHVIHETERTKKRRQRDPAGLRAKQREYSRRYRERQRAEQKAG